MFLSVNELMGSPASCVQKLISYTRTHEAEALFPKATSDLIRNSLTPQTSFETSSRMYFFNIRYSDDFFHIFIEYVRGGAVIKQSGFKVTHTAFIHVFSSGLCPLLASRSAPYSFFATAFNFFRRYAPGFLFPARVWKTTRQG